jgi:hypothetical protein
MSELNMENKTFTLKLISGEKVTGYFSEELRDAAQAPSVLTASLW